MPPIITARPQPHQPECPTFRPEALNAAARQRPSTVNLAWAWPPVLQSGQHTLTAADPISCSTHPPGKAMAAVLFRRVGERAWRERRG